MEVLACSGFSLSRVCAVCSMHCLLTCCRARDGRVLCLLVVGIVASRCVAERGVASCSACSSCASQ
eukprot:3018147-Alexandrium_andersonii.AAC.1